MSTEFKIDTKPLTRDGANYKTQKYRNINLHLSVIESTLFHKIFPTIFIILGLFGLVKHDENYVLFGSLFFIAIGVYLLTVVVKSIRIDKLDKIIKFKYLFKVEVVEIEDILLIQLISKEIESSDGNYDSFEINLVKSDGNRINMIITGDFISAENDAKKIAEFLNIKLTYGNQVTHTSPI